jgi:hypothetical protein
MSNRVYGWEERLRSAHAVGDLPLKDKCLFMCLHVIYCVYYSVE